MHSRKMLEWLDHPEIGRVVIPDSPLRFHGADRLPAVAAARLGQHTKEVLMEYLDMSQAEVDELAGQGAIRMDR